MVNCGDGNRFFLVVIVFIIIASVGIAYDYRKKQATQNSSFAAGAGEERKKQALS